MHNTVITGACWMLTLLAGGSVAVTANRHSGVAAQTTPYMPEYPPYFGNRIYMPPNNPLTREGVFLGRMLFYETALSANNTQSCASCHRQELAFTDGRVFSPGVDGTLTVRNAMSLENLLWVRQLFWDGRASSLEEQALTPLTNSHEMAQPMEVSASRLRRIAGYPSLFKAAFGSDSITKEKIAQAIAQFERTLISDHSRYDQYLQGDYKPNAGESAGMALFMTDPQPEKGIRGAGCAHCHGGPKLFLEQFHNNGLDSFPRDEGRAVVTGMAADKGRFRVPTLRNIGLTAPYMHDGRFKTLEEVLDHYSEHIIAGPTVSPQLRQASNIADGRGLALTGEEKRSVISFLLMLTDSVFIKNPEYANPHLKQNKTNKLI